MAANRRPVFTTDWPRYAVGAHMAFWTTSVLLIVCCIGAVGKLISGQAAILMFVLWLVAAAVLGVSAVCSGKLYVGNQVFAREPFTGWRARMVGSFAFGSATILILLLYGLANVRGV